MMLVLTCSVFIKGPFWVTDERLKMTAFTLPIVYDKTYLVVPKPGSVSSLSDSAKKVLEPFTAQLWFLIIFIIILTALCGLWFMDDSRKRPMDVSAGQKNRRKSKRWVIKTYCRLGKYLP